ncbi:hypothetical protein REPUB_Repub01dG0268400 [Reevesia pubescens]
MSSNTMATSNEWMQFREQTIEELSASSLGFCDATLVATSVSSESNLSPSTSILHSPTDHQLTPKGSSSKPIRRRSRASKKTPTTLLNASASNFRALVQQFTGCPSTPVSLGNRRGPVNLNFDLGSGRNQSGSATNSLMSASCNDYYYQQSHQEQMRLQENAPHLQQQQHAVSFDNVHHDGLFSYSSGRANVDHDQIRDGFEFDNISLQELNRDLPYSNENANDGNYFL